MLCVLIKPKENGYRLLIILLDLVCQDKSRITLTILKSDLPKDGEVFGPLILNEVTQSNTIFCIKYSIVKEIVGGDEEMRKIGSLQMISEVVQELEKASSKVFRTPHFIFRSLDTCVEQSCFCMVGADICQYARMLLLQFLNEALQKLQTGFPMKTKATRLQCDGFYPSPLNHKLNITQ